MRMGLKALGFTTALATAALCGISPSWAVPEPQPFGPATASLGSFDVPTVTDTTITLNGGSAQLSAGTGSLAGGPFGGTGAGTFSYSTSIGTTITESMDGLFSFSDGAGGQYVFDLTSVETTAYVNRPGLQTEIGLYLLGEMFDENLGLTETPTSLSLTFNSTGGSNFSESGSLANPPTPPVITDSPEPGALTLVAAGLIGLGVVRRRKQ